MKQENKVPEEISRRRFLRVSILAGAGAVVLTQISGCFLLDEPEMLVGTVGDLDAAGFLSPKFNRKRIFVTRKEKEIVTLSLICSHKKCTVEWEPEHNQFLCPCHEGLYDADGQVLDGPPPGPLKRYKTEIRGDEIWVLNQEAGKT